MTCGLRGAFTPRFESTLKHRASTQMAIEVNPRRRPHVARVLASIIFASSATSRSCTMWRIKHAGYRLRRPRRSAPRRLAPAAVEQDGSPPTRVRQVALLADDPASTLIHSSVWPRASDRRRCSVLKAVGRDVRSMLVDEGSAARLSRTLAPLRFGVGQKPGHARVVVRYVRFCRALGTLYVILPDRFEHAIDGRA